MSRLKFLVMGLFMLSMNALAQKTVNVSGYARIVQSDDMTPLEARLQVVEQARFDVINKAFGSNISQNNVTISTDVNGKSDVSFYMLGESDLRGTWIKDTEEPQVKRQIVDDQIVWEASVKGEAREVTRAPISFKWKLLAGGIDDRFEASELHDGDAFYIKFQSAVKGYLLVFLADDKGIVSCMVPYAGEDDYMVTGGRWHLLRYDEKHPEQHWLATMLEGRQVEYDQLYVVFSPNKVSPPLRVMPSDGSDLQRYGIRLLHVPELPFKDFQKYLGKLQSSDAELQVEKMLVRITRKTD